MKLSKTQIEVLKKMGEGWELVRSFGTAYLRGVNLESPIHVKLSTFGILESHGLIEQTAVCKTARHIFTLTTAGKEAVEEKS